METGTIKRIVRDKGFGFILPTAAGAELFFHRTSVHGNFEDLREGEVVRYESSRGPKGPRAERVESIR